MSILITDKAGERCVMHFSPVLLIFNLSCLMLTDGGSNDRLYKYFCELA